MQIILEQAGEQHAPASQEVVHLSLVGARLFVDIGEYEETYNTRTFKTNKMVDLNVQDVLNALEDLIRADEAYMIAKNAGGLEHCTAYK